jgi:hypothetical protein
MLLSISAGKPIPGNFFNSIGRSGARGHFSSSRPVLFAAHRLTSDIRRYARLPGVTAPPVIGAELDAL